MLIDPVFENVPLFFLHMSILLLSTFKHCKSASSSHVNDAVSFSLCAPQISTSLHSAIFVNYYIQVLFRLWNDGMHCVSR